MKNIVAITLDLDDTLWAIHPVINRAEQRLYAWLHENYPRITEKFSPDDMRQLRSDVIAEFADQVHDMTFLRHTVLSRAGSAAGYGTEFIDDAFAVFDAVRNDVDIFPEVIPALQALREKFVLIALTNGNANLEIIGINHLFHDVVTSAAAGAAKPARRIFDTAIRVAGATAEQTLHVGDHPEIDVDGARLAGLRTAWVNRCGDEWPSELQAPDLEVRDVGELAMILS